MWSASAAYISQGLGPGTGFIGGWLYVGAFAAGSAFTMAIASVYLQGVFVAALALIIISKGGAAGLPATPFSPAALPQGFSGLFFATVFSFTSFIGFEAAAVLGEETVNPL